MHRLAEKPVICQIFHIFGEILYERNIVEQEGWQVCYSLNTLKFSQLLHTLNQNTPSEWRILPNELQLWKSQLAQLI